MHSSNEQLVIIDDDDASEQTEVGATSISQVDSLRDNDSTSNICEFSIDWENIWHGNKRLIGVEYRPRHRRTVGTKIKESWIYQYGANLEHQGTRYWLCRECHIKKRFHTALYCSSGTAHSIKHLQRIHNIDENGPINIRSRNPFTTAASSSISAAPRNAIGFQIASPFNAETFKAKYIEWFVTEDITFRQASNPQLRWLIANGGTLASQLLPSSHGTVSIWLGEEFKARQKEIKARL